jgi:hypothetical protein
MYPATLGFWLEGMSSNGHNYTDMPDITLVKLSSSAVNPDLVRIKVEEFLASSGMQPYDKVRC